MSEVKLILDGERLDLHGFLQAVRSFEKVLGSVDRAASGGTRSLRWRLRTLTHKSPVVIGAFGEPISKETADNSQVVERAIVEGFRSLAERKQQPRPKFFSDDALEGAGELAEMYGRTFDSVLIVGENGAQPNPVSITKQVAASVEDFIGIRSEGIGAVQGKLEVVSSHNGLSCRVYDRVTGVAVKCTFPEALKRSVLDAFEQVVIAYGTVRRDASGKPRQISLGRLEPIASDVTLPQSLLGLDPQFTDGEKPEDWVRKRWE